MHGVLPGKKQTIWANNLRSNEGEEQKVVLVRCRRKGKANRGNQKKKQNFNEPLLTGAQERERVVSAPCPLFQKLKPAVTPIVASQVTENRKK